MKFITAFILAALVLSACNQTGKRLREKIADADSAAINYFKGDGSIDTVVAVRIIHDKATMGKLIDFITTGSVKKQNDCGYDGSVHFFKNDMVIQDVYFRMNDIDCMQFSFLFEQKRMGMKLSPEAKLLLETIKK